MARIWIGTSGWSYRDWAGVFYPLSLSSTGLLSYYAQHFDIVEINSTFYRLPSRETVTLWRASVPDHFLFACKASRYITHLKKLKDPEQSPSGFIERVRLLGDKLGPILFQLPPHWHADPKRLSDFLESLPKHGRYVFEFRDATWFAPDLLDLLAEHNVAFCIYDLNSRLSPREITADFVYLRLHGPNGPYQGSYHDNSLANWAKQLIAWCDQNRDIYCFFDNDEKGYAVSNALRLLAMVNEFRRDDTNGLSEINAP